LKLAKSLPLIENTIKTDNTMAEGQQNKQWFPTHYTYKSFCSICLRIVLHLFMIEYNVSLHIRVTDSDYHFGMKLLLQLCIGGRRMVVGFTTTAIKTKVLSMNAARGEVYSIQLLHSWENDCLSI
jgi:hypothetical protein